MFNPEVDRSTKFIYICDSTDALELITDWDPTSSLIIACLLMGADPPFEEIEIKHWIESRFIVKETQRSPKLPVVRDTYMLFDAIDDAQTGVKWGELTQGQPKR